MLQVELRGQRGKQKRLQKHSLGGCTIDMLNRTAIGGGNTVSQCDTSSSA